MIWAATVLVLAAPADPRLVVTRYQLEGRLSEALAVVDASIAERADEVRPMGFDYLAVIFSRSWERTGPPTKPSLSR